MLQKQSSKIRSKLFLFLLAVFVMLFSASCEKIEGSQAIAKVKNGVLEVDDTRTVQDALSASLDDLEWEYFISDNNSKIVEVTGIWRDNDQYEQQDSAIKTVTKLCEKVRKLSRVPKMPKKVYSVLLFIHKLQSLWPAEGDIILMQFSQKPDGDFEFSYGEIMDENGDTKQMKTSRDFLSRLGLSDEEIFDLLNQDGAITAATNSFWEIDAFLDLIYFPQDSCEELKKVNALVNSCNKELKSYIRNQR